MTTDTAQKRSANMALQHYKCCWLTLERQKSLGVTAEHLMLCDSAHNNSAFLLPVDVLLLGLHYGIGS